MASNPNGSSTLDPGQIIKRVYTGESDDALRIAGTISVSNQSVGDNGDPAPAFSNQAGGKDDSGNLQPLHVDSSGNLQVDVLTSPLPTGAATEATLSSFSSKSAAALVSSAYDYISQTYITSGNGTGQIGTVVFKSGGSGGTTVSTLTLAYDSSDRLISVTKT